ncbi:MAG TPA: AraC family transcriptional regulator [Caldisericia bacterium]|jgi:AraC-like DNA-binding protein|nr:AraC family transcriptional regulator [Caldisericia bacterium]
MDRWDQVNAVQRMQDFMVKHVKDPITLYDLAKISGYSPWHTGRIFKELTGKTPFEYLRAYRLSQAALMLRDEKTRVIDVAFDFVFDTPEGFTRSFSNFFGINPAYYKKHTPPIKLFLPSDVRSYYLYLNKKEKKMNKDKQVGSIFVQVIDRPDRMLMLKRGKEARHYFEYCEEVGCDIWGILCSIKEALLEPMGLWLPEKFRNPNTSIYAQGVEVPANYSGEVPEGFDLIHLPACKMMIFQGPPYQDDHFEEAIGEVWEALKTYDPKLYGFDWAEDDAPRFQFEPQGYRGYIEGRPVRLVKE